MEQTITCPKCGSAQITANKKGFSGRKAVAGAVLTGGIGLLAGTLGSNKLILTCLACAHRFRPGRGKIKNVTTTENIYHPKETSTIYYQEETSTYNKPTQTYLAEINTTEPTSTQSKKERINSWITVIMVFVIGILWYKAGCNNDNNRNSNNIINGDTNAITSTQKNIALLTHDDSIKAKQDLDELLKSINTINVEPRKAMKRFSHYTSGFANYAYDITQVFQAAKAAKQKMEYAEQEISDLNIPNILLSNQKDSLEEALSTISSSYLTMAGAFDLAMQLAQNPTDNSYAEAFREDMNQATQMYGESLSTILRIQTTYQKLHKNNSKPKHKNNQH